MTKNALVIEKEVQTSPGSSHAHKNRSFELLKMFYSLFSVGEELYSIALFIDLQILEGVRIHPKRMSKVCCV